MIHSQHQMLRMLTAAVHSGRGGQVAAGAGDNEAPAGGSRQRG